MKELLSVLDGVGIKLPKTIDKDSITELSIDIGRKIRVWFYDNTYLDLSKEATTEIITGICEKLSVFGTDNRAGISGTLHRVSRILHKDNKTVIGLTIRVGKNVIINPNMFIDLVDEGKNVLFIGKPGVGKTTVIRNIANILSTEFQKRVIIVDTSNEIGGEGLTPHEAVGNCRRMMVPARERQEKQLLEAVTNHNPQILIVDEILNGDEADALSSIATRGVQVIASVHGLEIQDLIDPKNKVNKLVGGIESVTISDMSAISNNNKKFKVQQHSATVFDVIVEVHSKDKYLIHHNPQKAISDYLENNKSFLTPEIRTIANNEVSKTVPAPKAVKR